MGDFRFRKQYRLRHRREFDHVFSQKARAGNDVLLVYGARNSYEYPRLGLTVSRKVGKATRRNRWKRLIREAFRLNRHRLPQGVDLVVIPRPQAQPTLESVSEALIQLAWRVNRKLQRRQSAELKENSGDSGTSSSRRPRNC